MAWQHWRKIDAQVTHSSNDATYKVKLPESNVLHALAIACEITNGGTSAQGQGLTDVVDWIKVIRGGSQVLYYLEPEHIRLMSLLELGNNLEESRDEAASIVQKAVYPIMFGRKVFDPEFYLNLGDGQDIELQIKYSPTISATTYTTGTFKTTVLGLMTLGGLPGSYLGTLVTRIIENFTTAASGDKVIKPPQRHAWRRLLVRCYEAAIADGVDITGVQWDLNDEERIPLNLTWNELHSLNQMLNPVMVHSLGGRFWQDTDTVATLLSRIRSVNLSPKTTDAPATDVFYRVKVDSIAGDTLTLCASSATIDAGSEVLATDATDRAIWSEIVSEGLPFAVEVPVNVVDEPPYFDSKTPDEVKLTLTQAAAGGDTDVILQEVQSL